MDLKSWENIKKKDFDFENVCLNFLIVILFYHSQVEDRLNIGFNCQEQSSRDVL